MAKHKFASISLTVRDRAFRRNFQPTGYLRNAIFAIFRKLPSPKMAAILNFRIFAKNGKTQICFYLLNRARWSDFVKIFDPQGICQHCTLGNFQKIFPSPKMAAILNFRIFAKNGKTQICFYLLNRARWSDFVKIFDPQGICQQCTLGNLKKIFPSPKMAAILNFRIFAKNCKTLICFYLLNRAR